MFEMDFSEFLFWCGMCITLGMLITFGGLFGIALFQAMRKVFRDE